MGSYKTPPSIPAYAYWLTVSSGHGCFIVACLCAVITAFLEDFAVETTSDALLIRIPLCACLLAMVIRSNAPAGFLCDGAALTTVSLLEHPHLPFHLLGDGNNLTEREAS
eukprot:scpid36183/ scgid7250/ 